MRQLRTPSFRRIPCYSPSLYPPPQNYLLRPAMSLTAPQIVWTASSNASTRFLSARIFLSVASCGFFFLVLVFTHPALRSICLNIPRPIPRTNSRQRNQGLPLTHLAFLDFSFHCATSFIISRSRESVNLIEVIIVSNCDNRL